MKILFLSHHWTNNSHHSLHSGFQRLVQFAAETNDVTLVTWATGEGDYMDGRIRVITVRSGRCDFLFQKRIAISRKGAALAKDFDAIHSLYEDCSFSLPRNRFTVTFHVLPDVVHYNNAKQRIFLFLKYQLIQRRALRRAATIACVSTNLLAHIPERYHHKACFIPHGIDTDFWDPALAGQPAEHPAELLASHPTDYPKGLSTEHPSMPSTAFPAGNYILCVGAHGLDRQLLTDFIRANPTHNFVIVGLKSQLDPHPNTHYLYNLSDEQLRSLYAGAAFFIRPLRFATANNSILEALSMGKTILASRIPGVTDYLTEKTAIFIDTLGTLSLDHWEDLQLDPDFIRQSALNSFSWRKIAAAYSNLYHQNQRPIGPHRQNKEKPNPYA
jgi:glycosyltransferase involved in cell wall biosynthesis